MPTRPRRAWALALTLLPTAAFAAPQTSSTTFSGATQTPTPPVTAVPSGTRVRPPSTSLAPDTRVRPPGTALPSDAPEPGDLMPASPPVISSAQIDRYEAIRLLQKGIASNPKALADWVILGEVAHEVAVDAPADQAAQYFRLSRDAFEKAAALQPNNPGLKAAAQFARDREADADNFEKSRDQATATYLEARRRDLAATAYVPHVEMPSTLPDTLPMLRGSRPAVAGSGNSAGAGSASGNAAGAGSAAGNAAGAPATAGEADPTLTATANAPGAPNAETAPAITPPPTGAASVDTANFGTRQDFSGANSASAPTFNAYPRYRPFASADGQPLTYQRYSNSYYPAGVYNNPGSLPVTVQRAATLPPARLNATERQILNGAGRATTPK